MGARTPSGLDTRGRKLWRDLCAAHQLGPAQLVLAEEACRLADRLDRMHALLAGDSTAWRELRVDEEGGEITVVISSVAAEARITATALKGIMTELRQATSRAALQEPTSDPEGGARDGVVDLAARVAARRAASTG